MVIKMNKLNKVLILLIVIFLMIFISSRVYAIDYTKLEEYKKPITEDQTVINKGKIIVSAFQAVGNIVSVGALIVIGIKYMMSSIEEKATMKESLIIYVIGAVLVFGISNISQVIYNWASKI